MIPSDTSGATQAADRAPDVPPHPDMAGGLRSFLGLDLTLRLLMWSSSLALATGALTWMHLWPQQSLLGDGLPGAWAWSQRLTLWVVLFNIAYVAELVIFRLLVPTPKEGRYAIFSGILPNRQVIWACLIGLLTKARYEAPFPGFLVFHVANLPPMSWLMNLVFGPRSKSCYATDPRIIDPHMVTIGRNVVIGFNTTVAGHHQERGVIVFKRTVIEDDVLVGGHALIFGGVRIRSGAVIGAGAVVLPNTVVGPDEFWAGVPARKIGDLPAIAGDKAV